MTQLQDLATEEVFSIWKHIIRDIFTNSFSNKPTTQDYQPDLVIKTGKARELFRMFRSDYDSLNQEELEYLERLKHD